MFINSRPICLQLSPICILFTAIRGLLVLQEPILDCVIEDTYLLREENAGVVRFKGSMAGVRFRYECNQ